MFEDSVQPVNFIVSAMVIGMGATALMDVWALFLKMAANISGLDYAMVGRWVGHMPSGKITHENIGSSPAIQGESAIGWIVHYMTGGLFAAALLAIVGLSWAGSPTLLPALATGLITVGFPWLLMQPCFGMGIAASKRPNARMTQMKSLSAHLSFGFGLYLSAMCSHVLLPG